MNKIKILLAMPIYNRELLALNSIRSIVEMTNIDKSFEVTLALGINSMDELTSLGTEQAFIRLQALDAGACMCLLYSIDGAISNTKWNQIPSERKQELKAFHKQVTGK